jgi:aminopeptidase N
MSRLGLLPLVVTLMLLAAASPGSHAADCPHSFDVIHYNVTLAIDIEAELMSGNTVIRSTCVEPGLDSITLDLTALTVDSILSEGTSLAYIHSDPVLMLHLARPYAPGDTFEVQVFYGGHPGNTGSDKMGGFYFEGMPKRAYQVGIDLTVDPPASAKYWIPCWDWPCDKATAEYHITVPGIGKSVICNGLLTGTEIDTLAVTSTFHWVENFPVAPCLMTVNAGKFAQLVDSTYDWISYWVYPRLVDTAVIHFENVPAMMDAFTTAFGPYPFPKCAYVTVPQADLGHQNCITHPSRAVSPSHENDWRVARGLTRQWWGACVTPGDWRDTWLTESFGRYGEPLFEEVTYGTQAYHRYVYEDLMLHTFADADQTSPIYDPNYPWNHTIYEKGTVVLHMLRFVLGDSVFFNALTSFRDSHAYGCATTADFQDIVESTWGQSVEWFFSEWIYDCGWPEFEYAWHVVSSDSGWTVHLAVDQVQTVGPVFTMPMDIGLTMAAGDTVFTIWIDEADKAYDFFVPDVPLSLEIDPDHWVLMKATQVPYAGVNDTAWHEADLSLSARSNPSRRGARIRYCVPIPEHVTIGIYDVAGRLVTRIFDGTVPAGPGELVWDGMSSSHRPASPGVYFCHMLTGRGSRSQRVVLIE